LTGPLEILDARHKLAAAENLGAAMESIRRSEGFGMPREGRAPAVSSMLGPTPTRSSRSSSNSSSLFFLYNFRDDISGGQQRPVD
jgi:hypothetical protein